MSSSLDLESTVNHRSSTLTIPGRAPEPERPFHPAAELFPLMEEDDYQELLTDISKHGLRESIVVDQEGRIIDGRNRYRACRELGIDVENHLRTWNEATDGTVIDLVVSLNLHRRHLNTGQRSMIAARVATMKQGTRTDRHDRTDLTEISVKSQPTSQADAGKLLRVSVDSLQAAKRVIKDGVPELVQAVEQGKLAVSTAAAATRLPAEEQRDLARGKRKKVPSEKEIVGKLRGRRRSHMPNPARITMLLDAVSSAVVHVSGLLHGVRGGTSHPQFPSWIARLQEVDVRLKAIIDFRTEVNGQALAASYTPERQ